MDMEDLGFRVWGLKISISVAFGTGLLFRAVEDLGFRIAF